MKCVLPPGHPLAVKKVLTPDDFHGENYISLSRTDSYRQLLDQLFTENQVKRRMIVENPQRRVSLRNGTGGGRRFGS